MHLKAAPATFSGQGPTYGPDVAIAVAVPAAVSRRPGVLAAGARPPVLPCTQRDHQGAKANHEAQARGRAARRDEQSH